MIIAIPSYKRADCLKTTEWLKSAKVIVPESQRQEYEELNEGIEIVGIPDDQDGNIGKKRNAILNLYKGEDVLMLDDDIIYVGYYEDDKIVRANEEFFIDFAENMFQMAKDMGTIMWGVGFNSAQRFYHTFAPFSLSSVILGPLTGIVNIDDELRYEERLSPKEDYDFALQVLKKYRKILRYNKWHYSCGHIANKGGIVGMRNSEDELKKGLMLQEKWGSKIVDIGRKALGGQDTINPIVRPPIKGI